VLAGKDRARANQVRAMINEDGRPSAAKFAASYLQRQALELRPWDLPPCRADVDDDDAAGHLLRRLLVAGLSRYDPDPLRALEAAS
jgi:hypothetical protein